MCELDVEIAKLAEKYRPLACEILKEAIRIPADHVEKDDPRCGLSNHEGPRLEYLKSKIIAEKAVEKPEDVCFDKMGNLVWVVMDREDGIDAAQKKVVYLDGHTDTVNALRPHWKSRIGEGIDAYDGLLDADKIDEARLRAELGFLPPRDEWDNLIFGRGSADQLAGVISQIVATKIMLELKHLGSLRGIIVRSYGTVAEEDNDGGAPMFICREVLKGDGVPAELFPDAVIYTEGTGDSRVSALGIYRGQRGRMQIEVAVTGKSCHGSMPWEGKNPLEAASLIIAEAADRYEKRIGFLDHEFLCHGTRTASWSTIQTPSDCAVPEKFTFRFDRRMTAGETPENCLADIEGFESVKKLREKGFDIKIYAPKYLDASWKGYALNNDQIYLSWITPEEHPAIRAAVDSYKRVVTPHVVEAPGLNVPKEPRVSRWIFSTDGVGFVVPKGTLNVPESKNWVVDEHYAHPPMFGIGAGYEQNTHKIGECVDVRELVHAIAFIARFPSALRDTK